MKRIALFVLLAIPLLGADSAAPHTAPTEPAPLSDRDKIQLLKLQNDLATAQARYQAARAVLVELGSKIPDLDARIQEFARSLQQKHAAVGYNLDEDLEWVKPAVPVDTGAASVPKETPDASATDRPQSVPEPVPGQLP